MADVSQAAQPSAPVAPPAQIVNSGTLKMAAGNAAKTTIPTIEQAPDPVKKTLTQADENLKLAGSLAADTGAVREAKPVAPAPVFTESSPAEQATARQVVSARAELVESENIKRSSDAARIAESVTRDAKAPFVEDALKRRQAVVEAPRGEVQKTFSETAPANPALDQPKGGSVDQIADMPAKKGPSRRAGATAALVPVPAAANDAAPAVEASKPAVKTAAVADAKFADVKAPVVVTASRSPEFGDYRVSTAKGASSFLSAIGVSTSVRPIRVPEPSAASVFAETASPVAALGAKPQHAPPLAAPVKAIGYQQAVPGTAGAPMAKIKVSSEKVTVAAAPVRVNNPTAKSLNVGAPSVGR